MGEEIQKGFSNEIVTFIPSHLTKGLIAAGISTVCGLYALWEFKQVKAEEVIAFIQGPPS